MVDMTNKLMYKDNKTSIKWAQARVHNGNALHGLLGTNYSS